MKTTSDYRQELRNKIINYAMREFYKRGIKAVKMDEISQGLHVSKRTVYEIFGDKEELLLAGMRAEQEDKKKCLEAFAMEGNHNVIDVIGKFYRLQMERNEQVGPLFYEEIHKFPRVPKYLKELSDREREQRMQFFQAGVKEGLFRADIDYALLSNIGHVAMNEIMHQQLYKVYSMQSIFDNYFMLLIRGVCTSRGAELLDQVMREE